MSCGSREQWSPGWVHKVWWQRAPSWSRQDRLGWETRFLQAEVGMGQLLSLCPGHLPQAWPRAADVLGF